MTRTSWRARQLSRYRRRVSDWTFITNHAAALLCIAEAPDATLREIGDCVGVRERTAHRLVSDLVEEGYVIRERRGSRNAYRIRAHLPMRHQRVRGHKVGTLLALFAKQTQGGADGVET